MRIFSVVLIGAIAASAIWANSYNSASSDVSFHYTVVRLLMDQGINNDLGALLGVNYYPPMPHWIAAVIASVIQKPMLAMMIVTVSSVTIIYIALFALLSEVGSTSLKAGGSILLILAAFGFHERGFFGFEVNQNFFFGQIVGEVLFWLWALSIVRLRQFDRRIAVDLFTLSAFFVCQYSHLVPALRIVGVYCFILVADSSLDRKTLWRLLFFIIASALLLFVHPATRSMVDLSTNDGTLEFAFATNAFREAAIAIFLAVISAALWLVAKRNFSAQLFAYIGLTISAFLLLQLFALELGYGSHYAVKKHLFAALTLFPLIAAIAGVMFLTEDTTAERWAIYAGGVAGLIMTGLVTAPGGIRIDLIDRYAAFARQALLYYSPLGSEFPQVAMSRMFPGVINAAITTGELRYNRNTANVLDIMVEKPPSEPGKISFAIVDRTDVRFPQTCDRPFPSSREWRIVDMSCVLRAPQ